MTQKEKIKRKEVIKKKENIILMLTSEVFKLAGLNKLAYKINGSMRWKENNFSKNSKKIKKTKKGGESNE